MEHHYDPLLSLPAAPFAPRRTTRRAEPAVHGPRRAARRPVVFRSRSRTVGPPPSVERSHNLDTDTAAAVSPSLSSGAGTLTVEQGSAGQQTVASDTSSSPFL